MRSASARRFGSQSRHYTQKRKKIAWRILPFVFVLYIISYLDRANVAFAKLAMTTDLGFSEAVFGFGAHGK